MPANHALPLPHSLTHLPDGPVEIARLLSNCRGADAAEALNRIGQTRALQAIEAMAPEVAVRVFNEPIWTMPPSSCVTFDRKGIGNNKEHLSRSSSRRSFASSSLGTRQTLENALEPSVRASLDQLLSYPEHNGIHECSGERHRRTGAEHGPRGGRRERADLSHLCSRPRQPEAVRVISLRQLVQSEPTATVISLPRRRNLPITVSPVRDRRAPFSVVSKYNLLAVPVVDADEQVLGIVTVDDVIDAISRGSC